MRIARTSAREEPIPHAILSLGKSTATLDSEPTMREVLIAIKVSRFIEH